MCSRWPDKPVEVLFVPLLEIKPTVLQTMKEVGHTLVAKRKCRSRELMVFLM